MAVSFVSSSSDGTQASTSLTVTLPSGLQDGDVLIAAFNSNGNTATITAPSGWTAATGTPVIAGSQIGGVWYRKYQTGVSNPTWTLDQTQKISGVIVAYRGVDGDAPFGPEGAYATRVSTTVDLSAPAVTTIEDGQLVVAIYMERSSSSTIINLPGGMTQRGSFFTTGGGEVSSTIAEFTQSSHGSTGVQIATSDVSSGSGYAQLLALQPASVAPGGGVFTGWGIPALITAALATNRFAGDPGEGNYYFGGREDQLTWADSETAITNWESNMSTWSGAAQLGIIRVYASGSTATGWTQDSTVTRHISHGRMVHISFKLPSGVTPADCVSQTSIFTTWMDALAAAFDSHAPDPIWWTFNHEPENDAEWQGAGAADYRTTCRNIKSALRSRGVTNDVFWTTGYMCPYTFGDGGGTRDWRTWYPDWKGTTAGGSSKDNPDPVDFYLPGDPGCVVDGIGLDLYSWWGEGDTLSSWDQFATLFAWASDRMDFLGLPYNIMEHGVQAYHTGTEGVDAVYVPATTLNYISAMFDTMSAQNIVAMQVFNYAIVDPAWRLEIQDPQKIRYEGYGTGMARPECLLPSEAGWL